MKWLDKLLGQEDHTHFTAEDYLKRHPNMHPTDAEALAKMNEILNKRQRSTAQDAAEARGR